MFNDRGHDPDCMLFLRQLHSGPDVEKRVEVSQMQICLVVDVSVTMQRQCGVDGDGVLGFSSAFYANFRAPLRS